MTADPKVALLSDSESSPEIEVTLSITNVVAPICFEECRRRESPKPRGPAILIKNRKQRLGRKDHTARGKNPGNVPHHAFGLSVRQMVKDAEDEDGVEQTRRWKLEPRCVYAHELRARIAAARVLHVSAVDFDASVRHRIE
jgi:hypothetical protein